MRKKLYAAFSFPDACRVDRRVYKKHFYDHGSLAPRDKRLFSDDVHRIVWMYGLKSETTGIAAYEDGEWEYTEIVLLEVTLNRPDRVERLAPIIHRSIPYPLVLVFVYENDGTGERILLSAASKRLSRSGTDALVVEEIFPTDWIASEAMTPDEKSFMESLRYSRLSHEHFRAWYEGIIGAIVAFQRAKKTGSFQIPVSEEERHLQQADVERYDTLEKKLTRLQAAIKREHQFNRQVELNMEINRIKDELRQLSGS